MSLPPEFQRRLSLVGLLFALLMAGVSAAGFYYYQRAVAEQRRGAIAQLSTIAEFKAVQLAAWRRERQDDAVGIAQDGLFVDAALSLLRQPGDVVADRRARAALASSLRPGKYSAFILFSAAGDRLLTMGIPEAGASADLSADSAAYLHEAVQSRAAVFARLSDASEKGALLDIFAPVIAIDSDDAVEAILVMRLDVREFLVPTVRFWPGRETTAETLLVYQRPDEVRFVVAPRRQVPPEGIPVDEAVPAAMAARGASGTFDGVDVRGVASLAAVRPVPATDWALVTKLDTAEVDAPIIERVWLLALTVLALISVAGIGVLALVGREQGQTYRRLYEESRERQSLAARFEALSSMANDILLLVTLKGRILDANDRAVEAYGYSREEFRNLTLRDIRPAQYHDELADRLREVGRAGSLRFESVHQRRDGTPFPVEASVRMLDDTGDGVMQAILRDISSQREAAKQILRLNSLLSMRSHINQAIVRATDAESLMRQVCRTAVDSGQFTLAVYNECLAHQTRLRLRFWAGTPLSSTYEGQEFPLDGSYGGPVADAATSGRVGVLNDVASDPRTEQWRQEALDAGIRSLAGVPVRAGGHGQVVGVLALCTGDPRYFHEEETDLVRQLSDDLTFALERLQALERRRQAEERFRTLFDAAPFALWVVDRESGLIRAANPAAVRQLGYDIEALADMPAEAVFGVEGLRESAFEEGVAQRAPLPLATRHRRKDGTYIDVEVLCRGVEFDGGPAWFVAAADVTERKRLEEQLRDAYRMESVGRLAGGIAHDFNNLLTAITGFATLAADGLDPAEPRHSHISQVQRAADRAAALTRQLLAFSRRQVLQPQIVDLNRTIADMGSMLERLVGEDVRLELQLDAPAATVSVDPAQIEQVLLNLVVNARDAMPRGGTLTLSTRVVTSGDRRGRSESGPWVQLSVADTGTGIPPEVQARIFEPFFTTKPKGQGTGLGLAMVHGIVTQSAGQVAVSSTPGIGTVFHVRLPQRHDTAEGLPRKPLTTPAPGDECVLLVEDDNGVRDLAANILKSGGYQVVTATDGLNALERRREMPRAFDLLLTDVVMPGMSGPELAERLRSLQPDLRVLFMSGYPDEALSRHGMGGQRFAFIQKPFSPVALLDKVRQVLDTEG